MRIKQERLVLTFRTGEDALQMERAASHVGRIIPTPPSVSAGCGMSFCAAPEDREKLFQLIQRHALRYEKEQLVSLYVPAVQAKPAEER